VVSTPIVDKSHIGDRAIGHSSLMRGLKEKYDFNKFKTKKK